jgi:hypothetical protein
LISGRARRIGGALACVVAAAAFLCGCNSQASRSQARAIARDLAAERYVAKLSALGRRFRAADQHFAAVTARDPSLPENAIAAPTLARAARAYAAGVAALTPPVAAARAPQLELVAVVREFAAAVTRVGNASSAGDPSAAIAAGRAASALVPRLAAASAGIERALDAALQHR